MPPTAYLYFWHTPTRSPTPIIWKGYSAKENRRYRGTGGYPEDVWLTHFYGRSIFFPGPKLPTHFGY
jgi:hypothetical protein